MQTGLLGLIAFFPLLGALVNGLTGGRLPKPLSGGVATLSMVASFVLSIAATWLLVSTGADDGHGHVSYTPLVWEGWTWMAAGSLDLSFSFAFDTLTAVMALVITGVGLLIHVFSIGYMHEDEGFGRYFAYLNLFVFAMLCLVLGDSLPVLFL
ncbi:MAG: NADH-quinone oxidoreductase subunit L, partial [Myxococcales bacterium]|nr:NADH-quinone oxidoreductase subunit L [Myxococcales bacterium]